MRDYNHWYTLGILSELLPLADNRVTLDPRCAIGMAFRWPAWSTRQCENDRKNIAFAKQTLHDIFEAADAQDVLVIDRYAHLVGGCRMGVDPEHSVVDSDHRVWGIPNLFIADGSVMPTQGSANPALTIMALSSRLAERLADGRLDAGQAGTRTAAASRFARRHRSARPLRPGPPAASGPGPAVAEESPGSRSGVPSLRPVGGGHPGRDGGGSAPGGRDAGGRAARGP